MHPAVVCMTSAVQADLEEGRNVFEEGNAFTMEAVQQQLDDLAAKHEAQVSPSVGPSPSLGLPVPVPRLLQVLQLWRPQH